MRTVEKGFKTYWDITLSGAFDSFLIQLFSNIVHLDIGTLLIKMTTLDFFDQILRFISSNLPGWS